MRGREPACREARSRIVGSSFWTPDLITHHPISLLMRYLLFLPLLTGMLLLAACERDTSIDQPYGTDVLTVDPIIADEFRADITGRLAEAEADINRLEQRMADVSADEYEQLSDEVRDLRQELLEIRSRFQAADIDSEHFWQNDHLATWHDVDDLTRRAERAVLENTTEPAELADEARERLDRIDEQLVATDVISDVEHAEIEEHMNEIDNHLTLLETVPADEFEDARDEIVDSFSDLRDMISEAHFRRVDQLTPRENLTPQPGMPQSEQVPPTSEQESYN